MKTLLHNSPPEILALRKKAHRDSEVSKILVTTSTGKVFDGDEKSQDRMARVVAVGEAGMTTQWKMADNSTQTATWEEIKEALLLAGQAQTNVWVA
ncbi:DUF4376 domain-containing protein [Neptunomonas japonica]|uniref:DUF4376 domain-containing protein n=1 Tax=Neptunomonas japonica JAMM 1380 TaxID=1441457 RepID=A0A7R6SVC0_9GAMM|nr:DUF4376 domain-containing protein [Neptunomonas japonica]BBB29384.1 hypothetical protein NEJAP_1432 [Neptunomonas japonica JAMM 1380]